MKRIALSIALHVAACVVLLAIPLADTTFASILYYSDVGGGGTINHANLDGSDSAVIVSNAGVPKGMAIDSVNEFLYWADLGGRIRRSGLDGTNLVDLVTGLDSPQDVELFGGKLYWTQVGKIQRANTDGTQVEDVVIGLQYPQFLAIDEINSRLFWAEDAPSGQTPATTDKIRRTNIPASGTASPVDVITGLDLT